MVETTSTIKNILNSHIPFPEGISKYSSVLMPLIKIDNSYNFIFSKRSMALRHQPGDICFPGGRREGNETPLETALRETYEEIGVPAENIEILGQPDFVVTTYGAVITPFVGLIKNMNIEDLAINPDEISELFTVPLVFFINTEPEAHYIKIKHEVPEDFPFEHIVGGKNYPWSVGNLPEYFYFYNDYVIWGFTARIIKNFCSILKNEI